MATLMAPHFRFSGHTWRSWISWLPTLMKQLNGTAGSMMTTTCPQMMNDYGTIPVDASARITSQLLSSIIHHPPQSTLPPRQPQRTTFFVLISKISNALAQPTAQSQLQQRLQLSYLPWSHLRPLPSMLHSLWAPSLTSTIARHLHAQ